METITPDCLNKTGSGKLRRVFCATGMFLLFNLWGLTQNITRVEYFFDTDPGQGLGVDVPVTPAPDISNLNFTIDITSLPAGFHNLFIRSKDANHHWCLNNVRAFYKQDLNNALPDITKMEFFFDTDPGYGHGINIAVTPGTNLANLSFTIDISSVIPGFHNLFVRGKDAYGRWGMTSARPFYKEPSGAILPNVTRVEYFIGTDPGMGLGTSVAFTPAANIINLPFTVETSGLPDGIYNLFARSKDVSGRWSITNSDTITVHNETPLPDSAKLMNVTVPNGIPACYDATHTILLGGNGTTFIVQNGGHATLIAGFNILFRPGTRIYSGGYLHGYITNSSQYCNVTQNPTVNTLGGKQEILAPIHPDDLFSVYPNPTSGKFILRLNPEVAVLKCVLKICNMTGATLLNEELNGMTVKEFSLSERPAGLYVISIMSGERIQVTRIVRVQ
ncbi:MAG: T9SS type A sorting domain-containing protein [Bacteroidota bacterium]